MNTKSSTQSNQSSTNLDGGIGGNIASQAKDITERARELATGAADSSISFAKKYPVHTALGALGVGCVVGFLARRQR